MAFLAISWALLAPPTAGVPQATLFPGADKVAHVAMFALLGALAVPAFPRRIRLAFALLAAYAVGTELAQSQIPGRSADALDLLADAAGLALAWLGWRVRGRDAFKGR